MALVPRQPDTVAVFSGVQRLNRVKERLATDYLQAVCDADCKAWYVQRTATALAPHLLAFYQGHIAERVTTQGLDSIPPPSARAAAGHACSS